MPKSSIVEIEPITVLVIDDHPLLRDGIAFALQARKDMRVVGEAEDGKDGLEIFIKIRPDIVLVDLQMPRMNGIDTIIAMRHHDAKAKIIVLTTYSGDAQVIRALKAGASGYLLKGLLRKELIETILAVHSGQRRIPAEIAADILGYISENDLTAREVEVLRSVAKGNSNKAVASHFGIAEETVKGHMKNILQKLGANDRTHAVTIGMKRGFLDS